jgi:dolichol-phosphate mannosyltransferase
VALPEVDVSLTIPAHNEAENIGRVLHDVMAVLDQRGRTYEIVLVDDASHDGTAGVARAAMGDNAQNLTVVTHKQQRGYAITVCDGLRASRGKILAFMDGDGQFDPHDLAVVIGGLDHVDMVAGIRNRRADPWYRSFVSGVYNRVVRIAFASVSRTSTAVSRHSRARCGVRSPQYGLALRCSIPRSSSKPTGWDSG